MLTNKQLLDKYNAFNLDPKNNPPLEDNEVAELFYFYRELMELTMMDERMCIATDYATHRMREFESILDARRVEYGTMDNKVPEVEW